MQGECIQVQPEASVKTSYVNYAVGTPAGQNGVSQVTDKSPSSLISMPCDPAVSFLLNTDVTPMEV